MAEVKAGPAIGADVDPATADVPVGGYVCASAPVAFHDDRPVTTLTVRNTGDVRDASKKGFIPQILDTIFTIRDFNESPNGLIWNSKAGRQYAKAYDKSADRRPPHPVNGELFESEITPALAAA